MRRNLHNIDRPHVRCLGNRSLCFCGISYYGNQLFYTPWKFICCGGRRRSTPSCVHIYCPVPEPEPVLTMPYLCPVPEPERITPDPPSPPPDEFLCPISFEIMTDPVITAAGFTYERAEIEHWFRDINTDPQARSTDINKTLTPNIQLRQAIERYKQARRS